MSVYKIEVLLSKLKQELIQASMIDGKYSPLEQNIIYSIEENIPIIRHALKQAQADLAISKEEKLKINDLVKKIMDDAVQTAKFDNIIQDEENLILMKLRNSLIEVLKQIKTLK